MADRVAWGSLVSGGAGGSSVLSVEQRTAMNPPSVDFVAPRNRVSRASSATMHSLQMHAYGRSRVSLSIYIYIFICIYVCIGACNGCPRKYEL